MELRGELKFLFESNEGNYVYWFERRNKGVFVTATPIDVSAILARAIVRAIRNRSFSPRLLWLSKDRFNFLKQRLGD